MGSLVVDKLAGIRTHPVLRQSSSKSFSMGGSGKLKLIKNNLHFTPSFTCSVRTYRDYIVWEKKSQRTNLYLTKRAPIKPNTGRYTISNIGRSDVGYIGWKAQKISKMQMPHNLDRLEWITNKTRCSSLSQEINKKQKNLIPINGQSSSASSWKLLLVAAAKLLVFKIDIEVPAKMLHVTHNVS